MNGLVRKSFIPDAEDHPGGAPAAARSAAMRPVPRSAAMCLAPVLLLVSLTASAALDEPTDHFLWEVHQGCKNKRGTKAYLDEAPNGLHAREARECLKRWENDEQAAWDRIKGCTDMDAVKRFRREYPESPYDREASECIADLERRKQIERRLEECRAHFRAGRIVSGLGGNALECYGKVLGEDPGNPEALKGMDEIVAHYSAKAATALDRGDPVAAEREIERLEEMVPESAEVAALRGRLEDLTREIADQERIRQEREALSAEAEELFERGEYEEVVALVSDARKRGLEDKRLSALNRDAEARLAEAEAARSLKARVAEVRNRIERGDLAGARVSLDEAKRLGLDDETFGALAAEIDEAERAQTEAAAARARDAFVSEARAMGDRGDYEAAREALRRALDEGLSEARFEQETGRIDRLEAAQLLATCREHKSRRDWQVALECVRRVIELDADNAEAREEARQLAMLVAFSGVYQSPSVEGYFQFIQDYSWSPFVDAANEKLKELESAYWEEVKAADTPQRYRRYLEIYPAGRYADEARRRSSGGG